MVAPTVKILSFPIKNVIFAKKHKLFVGTGVPDGPQNEQKFKFYKKCDFCEKFNKDGRPMVAPAVKILNFSVKNVIFAKKHKLFLRTGVPDGPQNE
ncbi:MAG: hypothetical protein E7608_00635 [Ruminococcaceae bacterium]|nr:hypothetical protein [Oscillospiraceae bacterium]